MDSLNELSEFIRSDSRLDVKTLALHHVLSMTGDFESRNLMLSHPSLLISVIILAFKKDEQKWISKVFIVSKMLRLIIARSLCPKSRNESFSHVFIRLLKITCTYNKIKVNN
jgi:hypothetical protein